MKTIRVFHHYSLIPSGEKTPKSTIGVVIDVLRATTSMVHAVESGCPMILPVSEVSEAFALRDEVRREKGRAPLLGGEREGVRIEGFDLGNSPREFSAAKRPLILTTSNGTRAIVACGALDTLLIGSFLNGAAVVQRILADLAGKTFWNIWLVCSGTGGAVAAEDSLLAGLLTDILCSVASDATLDDGAILARDFWRSHSSDWTRVLSDSANGLRLKTLGLEEDIFFACQRDVSAAVPTRFLLDGRVVLS